MSDTPFVVPKVEWLQFRAVVDDSAGHAFGCARLNDSPLAAGYRRGMRDRFTLAFVKP